MSERQKSRNDKAWEALFDRYDILSHIETEGKFVISAAQIKEYREPRLMAKFDHSINLPVIFSDHDLAILPVSRGDYVISHFQAYQPFEVPASPIRRFSLPSGLQSLNANHITSETIALNCALASGMLSDFLEEDILYSTVSGRMGSDQFDFSIRNVKTGDMTELSVKNSQIEIDAALEGARSLALLEAKRDLSEDFLIRQLYYPFRVWDSRVTKKVRPVFLVYTNGIFQFYEYEFEHPGSYNSLVLKKHRNYSIEDTEIKASDLWDVFRLTEPACEPEISFPQANRFERVINLCELLHTQDLSREQVTEEYAFDIRQTNYYTDAARYLGLIEKRYGEGRKPFYSLTPLGRRIMRLNYTQRQLAFCEAILRHRVFRETLSLCLERDGLKSCDTGQLRLPGCEPVKPLSGKYPVPDAGVIVGIMRRCGLYKVGSTATYVRRSSTISGWINWMLRLIKK